MIDVCKRLLYLYVSGYDKRDSHPFRVSADAPKEHVGRLLNRARLVRNSIYVPFKVYCVIFFALFLL